MKRHFVLLLLCLNIYVINGNHAALTDTQMPFRRLFKRQTHMNMMQYQGPYTVQRINDPYLGNVDIQVVEVDQFGNPIVPYQRPNNVPVNTNVYPQTYNRGGNDYEIKVLEVDEQGNVYQQNMGTGDSQYVGNIYQQNQHNNPNIIRPNNYPGSVNTGQETVNPTNTNINAGNNYPQTNYPGSVNMGHEIVNPANTNNNAGNTSPQTEAPRTINQGTKVSSHNYPSLDELISKSDSLIHVPPKKQENQPTEVPDNSKTNRPVQQNEKPQTEKTPVQPDRDAPFIFDSSVEDNSPSKDQNPKTPAATETVDVMKNREDVLQHTPTFGNPDPVSNRQGAGLSELQLNAGEIRK